MPVFALVLASLVKTRLEQLRQRHKAIMLLVKKGKNHPANRASFCLFLSLPESRQLFDAAAARTSGLVNLVFSRQTGFSSASVRLVTKPMVIIKPAVP